MWPPAHRPAVSPRRAPSRQPLGHHAAPSGHRPDQSSLIQSSCSATHTRAPMSPTSRVPTVRVEPKSATGAGSAEPHTACRANGRCLAGSHHDWEAMRSRRPPIWRSNMFLPSASHLRKPFASEISAQRKTRSILRPSASRGRAGRVTRRLNRACPNWQRCGKTAGQEE